MNGEAGSLERLHDLIIPAPASWWPLAPGWLWLGGITFLFAVFLVLRAWQSRQRNRYRREALAELLRSGKNPGLWAVLLKRTALSAFPRQNVAALTGPLWFDFLDRSAGMKSFAGEAGREIEFLSYDPRKAEALSEDRLRHLRELAEEWIRKHDPEFEQKKC